MKNYKEISMAIIVLFLALWYIIYNYGWCVKYQLYGDTLFRRVPPQCVDYRYAE